MMFSVRFVLSLALVGSAAVAVEHSVHVVHTNGDSHYDHGRQLQQHECQLSAPIALTQDQNLYLEQVKNSQAGTYTMRLTYTGGHSWIGIGINSNGRTKMTPAMAVIGRADSGNSVMYYSMTSDSSDGSGVQPVSSSTLQDASFSQTSDGTTSVLQFTQDLSEMQVSDDSTWIFAVGFPDNVWEGKHPIHGSFQMALADACQQVAAPTSASPTSSPQVATTTTETSATTTTTTTSTAAPTVAPNNNNNNVNNNVMTPVNEQTEEEEEDQEDQEWENEEEEDENESEDSVDVVGATNIVTSPTTTLSSSGSNTLTTSSSSSAANGIVFLDTTHPHKQLWMAHGILLFIAWGICAPLAIGASLLRQPIGHYLTTKWPTVNWFAIHFYLNVTVLVLTLVGFFLAVIATQLEGQPHFHYEGATDADGHHKIGLAVAIMVVAQSLAGIFRPAAPKPPAAENDKETATGDLVLDGSSDEEDVSAPKATATTTTTPTTKTTMSNSKSMVRIAWEWSHRLLGLTVLGFAWWNCYTGIELQLLNWQDSMDWTRIFWGITIGISGLILISWTVNRFIKL